MMENIVISNHLPHQYAFDFLKCGSYLVTGTFDESADIYTLAWVTRVSTNPPIISIVVNKGDHDHDLIINSDYLIVHLIADGQIDEDTLKLHRKIPNKKTSSVNNAPLLIGSFAAYGCKNVGKVETDTQTIIIATIDYSEINHTKTPYHLSKK